MNERAHNLKASVSRVHLRCCQICLLLDQERRPRRCWTWSGSYSTCVLAGPIPLAARGLADVLAQASPAGAYGHPANKSEPLRVSLQ
jgi:hypothetical protein